MDFTLKNKSTNSTLETFVEFYDLKEGKWNILDSSELDLSNYEGNAIFGICANDTQICVLFDKRINGGEDIQTFIDIYDAEHKLLNTLKIPQEIHDYVMTSAISDMQVIGDYIYLYNASNYGLLGKVNQGEFIEVLKGRNLEIAPCLQRTNDAIFYIRRDNIVYILDAESEHIIDMELDIGNSGSIMTMFATNDNVMVICYGNNDDTLVKEDGNEGNRFVYLIGRNYIADCTFPCALS